MVHHRVEAEIDSLTAAVTCPECTYSFVAPVAGHRIDLKKRTWYDRGNGSVAHVLMPRPGNPDDGIST